MRRKKERSKQGQTNKQGKATQHTQGSHFSCEAVELPRVGLEPTTLYTLDRALYQLSYRGSSLGPNLTSHSTPDEQANHVQVNAALGELQTAVDSVATFHQPPDGKEGDRAAEPSLLSQLPASHYTSAEDHYLAELTAYTKKQFFQVHLVELPAECTVILQAFYVMSS